MLLRKFLIVLSCLFWMQSIPIQAQNATVPCSPDFPDGLIEDFISEFVLPYTGIVTQEYVLEKAGSVYYSANNDYFGRAYDFALLIDGKLLTRKDIYHPWETDEKFIDTIYSDQHGYKTKRLALKFKSIRSEQFEALNSDTVVGETEQFFYKNIQQLDSNCTLSLDVSEVEAVKVGETQDFKVVIFFADSREAYIDQRVSYRIFSASCTNLEDKWYCPDFSVPGKKIGGICIKQSLRPGEIKFSVVSILDEAGKYFLPISKLDKKQTP